VSGLAHRARRRTGLSQRAFAALLDVHPSTVARWETGERQVSAPACALLLLIEAEPRLCAALLAGRAERASNALRAR